MDDAISRQAAIDAVRTYYDDEYALADSIEELIEKLPSAQPERMRGKWIYGEDEYGIDGHHCNQCGFFVPWDYAHKFINYIEDYHFCPNCGAEMEVSK